MSVIGDRKEFNMKCLGINISAQTMEGVPFNIVDANSLLGETFLSLLGARLPESHTH